MGEATPSVASVGGVFLEIEPQGVGGVQGFLSGGHPLSSRPAETPPKIDPEAREGRDSRRRTEPGLGARLSASQKRGGGAILMVEAWP